MAEPVQDRGGLDVEKSPSLLLRDFVLDRCNSALHHAHPHVSDGAAWLVEEVDNAAGKAA